MNNELIVILYILSIIAFAYFWFYPKLKLFDIYALSFYDLIVSLTTLFLGWFFFGDKEISFSLYFIDTTWYWYTIVIYFIIEGPFVLWYFKKHNIF